MNHILISGGIYHDFDETSAALARLGAEHHLDTQVFTDPEQALRAVAESPQCRLLTVNALRFSMTQHEKYAPFRGQWAFTLSARARSILAAYVARGGALLGLHTAGICFEDWAEWGAILGAQWQWGRSHHPPAGPVAVEVLGADELTTGVERFQVVDEVYHDLRIAAGATPILRARAGDIAPFQPVMWTNRYGEGRVVYDSLGHSKTSLEEPSHHRVLRRAVEWLLQPLIVAPGADRAPN